jgi:hypothetical protein
MLQVGDEAVPSRLLKDIISYPVVAYLAAARVITNLTTVVKDI